MLQGYLENSYYLIGNRTANLYLRVHTYENSFLTAITLKILAYHSFCVSVVFSKGGQNAAAFAKTYLCRTAFLALTNMITKYRSRLWSSRVGLQNTPTASLQRGKTLPTSVLDMILNNLMLELWEMWSTPSSPSLPGPLWPGVVTPDRVLFMGQIELNWVLMLNWIVWNRTVYMYKNDLALNNLQWLICHKTKPN